MTTPDTPIQDIIPKPTYVLALCKDERLPEEQYKIIMCNLYPDLGLIEPVTDVPPIFQGESLEELTAFGVAVAGTLYTGALLTIPGDGKPAYNKSIPPKLPDIHTLLDTIFDAAEITPEAAVEIGRTLLKNYIMVSLHDAHSIEMPEVNETTNLENE